MGDRHGEVRLGFCQTEPVIHQIPREALNKPRREIGTFNELNLNEIKETIGNRLGCKLRDGQLI
jgi:hypothetical protein